MADDCDEDVIFEHSALYKHLVDAGVPDIPVESTGKKPDGSSHTEKDVNHLSQRKNAIENVLQFWETIYNKLKIHLSLDLLFTKLHSHQNHLLLQKIIQSKALEDDDKIFLENYISETRESADLKKGKEALLCCVYPLFAIILLYMWCVFSPLSAMILMNPSFSLIRLMMKGYLLMLVALIAVICWHVLLLQHTARQVLNFIQQTETSVMLQKKSLRLIQEVELVRKGFTLVSSRISMSKTENSSHTNQRLCTELRHLLFLSSRSNMLFCRKSTGLLLEHYPLIDEVDKASTYLANIPLEDYGPSLQDVQEDDAEKSKENLSKLTDDFSVTALKAMCYLYGMQQSEFVRRLALCFCINAQPESQKGKLDSSIGRLVEELKKHLTLESMKLGNSYEFHRSSFQERDAKSSPVNQKQAMSSVSELYMAIHSLDLHLRAALHRSFALSTELEKFSEDEIQDGLDKEGKENDEEIQENLNKKEKLWFEQLASVKAELEACRGCWEVGLDKINKIYKKKSAQVPKLSPMSEVEPGEMKVISADDIDPVIVDEVFEDYTDPDKDEFECNYVHLSPEEREKREQDREENRRMMFELRNVIAVRATDMERREEIAIKRNQVVAPKDDPVSTASNNSSDDAEQSDDSLHTDSLQSDSLQSDLPNKDIDPMQQSGNLNDDLIDEDPLASEDEFSASSNKPKDLNVSEETSVNKISWSKSLSLNSDGGEQGFTPFFLHGGAVEPVETDHLSDLQLRNLLFSPGSEATDTESLKTDSLQENSETDPSDSLMMSDITLPPTKNEGSMDQENNLGQFPSDQAFSFILHPQTDHSPMPESRSPSLTPTHHFSNTSSNHINNNASSHANTDLTTSSTGSGFFLHNNADDDDSNIPLPKRSLQGTNLMDLQERWAANSGGPGLSLTRNIAALASARCKELNLNIQTFGDEEETFGDDSFDEDDDNDKVLSTDDGSKTGDEKKD